MKRNSIFSMFLGLVMAATPAGAAVLSITYQDLPGGDILNIPQAPFGDELGFKNAGFPLGERITTSFDYYIGPSICDNMPNNSLLDDYVITIKNLQNFQLGSLYYVVNGVDVDYPTTGGTFSNYDGIINGALAMQIDWIGANRPLIDESKNPDGILEANETWQFVVVDYLGGPDPNWFGTAGLVGLTDTNPSILIPEPGVVALNLLGGLLLLRRRR
jgi:hypothetical protein